MALPSSGTAVGRLAPSPTGGLHLGNVRSFVLAWLDVRARQGRLLLRMEDLDFQRVQAHAEAQAMEDLQWLGLDWDGEIVHQRERQSVYAAALAELQAKGLVYPCVCSRKDIEQAASAPHGQDGVIYPNTCRDRFRDEEHARKESGVEPCWRFRAPEKSITQWSDEVLGDRRCQVHQELGDFVVWKRDGQAAYQLAVVVDDIAGGVNRVLRGDDLVWSTARQLLIYEALGAAPPHWIHVPLVVDVTGRRLAKRDGDASLRSLQASGASRSDVLRWLAQSWGVSVSAPPTQLEDLLEGFDLQRLPRRPVVWNGSLADSPLA